jgi:hypothetical protein
VYFKFTGNGETFHAFSIYAKKPSTTPDLTSIQSYVKQFCGNDALDVTSSYPRQFSYANNVC